LPGAVFGNAARFWGSDIRETKRNEGTPSSSGTALRRQLERQGCTESTIGTEQSRPDTLVARYYPALYSFASHLTDGPRQALLLADHAFDTTPKQLSNCCDENVFASLLFANVIWASKQLGLAGPDATLKGRIGR